MTVGAVRAESAPRDLALPPARWIAPAVPLVAAASAFAWTLHEELLRLYGLTGSAWDFAYDQQVIWNVANGHGFYSSFAKADFLGVHFELIFLPLALVEKLWPHPALLLIYSSAGLAATAPAAYRFFRAILPVDRPLSKWLAVGLSAPIPFWASIQEAARDFFHPENMALALALTAAWAGIRGHRKTMWLLCVLVLMCKEDQVFTVGVIGILMFAYGAPTIRKHARFIIYLAGFWFLIGVLGLQTYFRNGGYSDFVYYKWLFLHPTAGDVLAALFRPQALLVVAVMIVSLFGMPLLAPRWLLLVVPAYILNVLSGHYPQYILLNHYALLLMFPLIVSAGAGARRFATSVRSIRPAMALAPMVPALILGFGLGQLPPSLLADHGEQQLYQHPDQVSALLKATAMIPADAPVSADNGLAVWLANRHKINDFPDMLEPSCYVVLQRDAYMQYVKPTDVVNPAKRQAAIERLASDGRRVLYDDGKFQVWSPVGG
jgi:uncharacterized membrane protein